MKILFFGDECREFWNLLPVMNVLKERHTVAFGSPDQNALSLAAGNNISIINPVTISYDALVVNKMHYRVSRDLSELYATAGKPVIFVEHAWDGSIHLLDSLWGSPINFFTVFAVSGKHQYDLLRKKHGDKIRLTGIPRIDKLLDASSWNKQEIYTFLGTTDFWLIALPPNNHLLEETEREYFEVLPRLLDAKPIYKIHPCYSTEPYLKYDKVIIKDDTLVQDITYELINASKGIVTTIVPSFMSVEASILQKPVIGFGTHVPTSALVPELGFLAEDAEKRVDCRIFSSPASYGFNEYQKALADSFPHDGKNSERVADLIEEVLGG